VGRWVLGLVVLAGMLSAACGSADPAPVVPAQIGPTVAVIPYVPGAQPTATPTPTPTPDPTATPTPQPPAAGTPAAAPALWSAVFRYADVPAGWSRTYVDNQLLMIPDHLVCDGKWMGDPAYYVTSAGIQFQQSDAGPVLMHSLWQSASTADAQKEMAFNRQTFACATWDETTTDGTDIVFHLQPLTIPQVGDESVAAHMTVAVSGKTVLEVQSVYLRVGPVLSEVTLAGGSQSDPTLLAALAKSAVQRIHDAGF